MTTKCITTCDGCGTRIEEANSQMADYGFILSSYYVRTGGDDPLPTAKHFCRFKCLAIFVAQGKPEPHSMAGSL